MVLADQRTCPPSLCSFITLITYQFSLLLFVCLCLACLWLAALTYPSPTPPYCTVVGLSTYLILSFLLFHSTVAPIILLCSKVFFSPKFFLLLPPWVLSPTFHFPYPFHLPDFLQPACFSACLFAACSLCCLCCSVVVRVSWTDAVCGRSFALLTHGQHHTRTQAVKHVCGVFRSPRPGP